MNKLSIKQKSYLVFLMLLLICSVMAVFLVTQVRSILYERETLHTVQLVERLGHDVDMLLSQLDGATSQIVHNEKIHALFKGDSSPADVAEGTKILQNSLALLPGDTSQGDFLVVTKDARILAATSETLVGKYRLLGVEWVTKIMRARDSSVRITGYNISKGNDLTNTRVMSIAQGVFIDDRYEGMIVLDIPTSILEDICQQVHIGENGFVSVIDEDNLVMFSTNWVDMGNQFKQLNLESQSQGVLTTTLAGEPMVVVFTKSVFSGMTIVGALPLKEVYSPVTRLTLNTTLIIVMFIVALLFVVLWIVLSVSKPILFLATKMKEVEGGDFSVRVPQQRKDEIGVLEKGFNTMLHQVEDLIEREYKANLNEREAQLNELTAIINPHFIYNTLEIIKMNAYLNDDRHTVEMLAGLARLFRIMTDSKSKYIPLKEELAHCMTYLNIMAYREEPKISVSFNISDELLDCYTLKFILQPLVENSILHGFLNRAEGDIHINATRTGENVTIKVWDNGEGMDDKALRTIKTILTGDSTEPNKAHALYNIHQRIRLAFGDQCGLTLRKNEAKGTTAILVFPFLQTIPKVSL